METFAEFTKMNKSMDLTTALELATWLGKKEEVFKGMSSKAKADLVCRVMGDLVKKEVADGPEKDALLLALNAELSASVLRWMMNYLSAVCCKNAKSVEEPVSLSCASVEPLVLRSIQEPESKQAVAKEEAVVPEISDEPVSSKEESPLKAQ